MQVSTLAEVAKLSLGPTGKGLLCYSLGWLDDSTMVVGAADGRAHVLGVKPSAWARAVMLDALDSRSAKVAQLESNAGTKEAAPTSLVPAVEQLRRVGVNLNQALRKGAAVDDGLLHEVMVAVDEVRASLGDRTRT